MYIIRSEIIRVISKSNERAARVRFEIKSMISDSLRSKRFCAVESKELQGDEWRGRKEGNACRQTPGF